MRHARAARATACMRKQHLPHRSRRGRLCDDVEELSKPEVFHAVDNANTMSDDASELLVLMREITGRLDRLEESKTRLMDAEVGHGRYGNNLKTPLRNSGLFVSALGRGTRMDIISLERSSDASVFIRGGP